MREVYIVDGIRSPIGKLGGSLSQVRADDLAAQVIAALIARNPSWQMKDLGEVYLGCANQAGEDNRNVARMALLLAGLPQSVPGETINRLCASGLCAVINAYRSIALGDAEFIIAGGVEQMTRAPYVLSKTSKNYGRDQELFDTTMGWRFVNPALKGKYGCHEMGETAEEVAQQFSISRTRQDEFACYSQIKAAEAIKNGRLAKEIAAIEYLDSKKNKCSFDTDEFVRPDTTLEILARLKPVFRESGTVTAGTSSGINDGAAALLVASKSACDKVGIVPTVRIVASATVGVEPRIMGIGPVEAIKTVLNKSGLRLDQMDIIEINEAFAAQSLACLQELGLPDNDPRVNPNGGAIALGHPLGMSGARLVLTAKLQLELTQKKYALCSLCVGVGQGVAMILERV